jgi:sugar phosphate isomerase/epimerase
LQILTNITNTVMDLDRYKDGEDLRGFCRQFGLDGLELLPFGELGRGYIPKELISGLHLTYFNCWVDYWKGNLKGIETEFDSYENARQIFKGGRQAIIDKYRAQLDFAEELGAGYVVFHVSDVSLNESVSFNFLHSDEEVIDASLELINLMLEGRKPKLHFLVENLWWPGFNMTRPELTRRLIDGIKYDKKGIMLDTGHLMHTNADIRSQQEAIAYIHTVLDRHGQLCGYIKGIHLNQSLSGAYLKEAVKNPIKLNGTYSERLSQVYPHIFSIDKHRPFEIGLQALIKRINPLYLTHEFLTDDREEHGRFLQLQNKAISMD